MKIQSLPLYKLPPVRKRILSFLKRYGEKRITHQALRWFTQLNVSQESPGTLILVATERDNLIGVVLFGNYGLRESLIVVHPDYRKQGVGEEMVKHSLQLLPKIYARVATDNLPSLKLCFTCGLTAFQIGKGPTGKPTLWLGAGDWHPDEIRGNEQKSGLSHSS